MTNSKQNAWNFASLFIYFGLVAYVGYLLKINGLEITEVSIRDLILITLATYRLVRIIVFEKIFKFFRDFVKSRPSYFVLNTMKFIITCPWCMGVWAVLFTIVFYYFVPYGVLFVYILAISGVASIFVMIANLMILKNKELQKDRDEEG